MKIIADECVDNGIVARLRKDGHEVSYVAEVWSQKKQFVFVAYNSYTSVVE